MSESPTEKRTKRKPARGVYPLDISGMGALLRAAQRRTRIKSKAQVLRLAIERGLPILEQQLASHRAQSPA